MMHWSSLLKMAYVKKRKKVSIPDWILQALKVLKPPEKLTVSEWADKYRILDAQTSAEPGKWNTSRTEYLKGIMNAFTDVEVEKIVFVKPTQVGGTECLNNMIGYVIAQDPSPTMIVYPTEKLAEFTSKKRVQPMVALSPVLAEKYRENESKLLELNFNGMYIVLVGSNSASDLASRPVRFIFFDEVDKYPTNAGKEADPISLAKERTRTFPNTKKIFLTSTPTLKRGPIWQEWLNADSQYQYFVPCPHCGVYQKLIFKQVKWKEDTKSPKEARETAYYECESCKGTIQDNHKPQMIRNGEWRCTNGSGKRSVAFHLNAIYSPWVRFGDVAYEFVSSHNYPEKLMNFINSWLGEPWEDTKTKMDSDIVFERQSEYTEGIVPDEALILTGGVDVQKDCFYFTIRAWGPYMTSWNVLHGKVETWEEIDFIMNQSFSSPNGQSHLVNLTLIDSGNDTENVYQFCVDNQDWAMACKGSSNTILAKYKLTNIDKIDSCAYGMRLCIVDGSQYKNMIYARMRKENGLGSWMVYDGIDMDYARQVTSEEKVIERRGGRDVEVWKTKTSHADNHYLDCEVYAAAAADLLHVRYMMPQGNEQESEQTNQDSWINNNKEWI